MGITRCLKYTSGAGYIETDEATTDSSYVAYDLTVAAWKEGFLVGRDSVIVCERLCGCTKLRVSGGCQLRTKAK